MNNLVLSELTGAERRNIKHLVKKMKKEKENPLEQQKKQEKVAEYKKQLIENKDKRTHCFEENRKRKIEDPVFEKLMKEYEKEGYELELEIARTEKEMIQESFYLKRINCLLLLLGFLDGVEKIVITDTTGKKRYISLQEMCNLFLTFLVEEEEKTLENTHKVLQLYMLINSIKENPLDEKHPFYLNEEEKIQTYSKILEIESKRKKVEQEHIKNDSIPFQVLCVDDFLNTDIDEIYNRLFIEEQEKRKRKKSE